MTKTERAPYHHLAWKLSKECRRVGIDFDIGICSLCRFADSDSWGEARCTHPSDAIRYKVEDNAMMNVDCWAFRPRESLAAAEENYREWIAEIESNITEAEQ